MSSLEQVAELHRRQVDMYAGGPVAPILELLAEDIVWHVPGSSPVSGDHRGLEQVVDYFERRRELADETMRMRPGPAIVEGDCVAQFVEGIATLGGRLVTWQTLGVYRLDPERGKFQEVWLVPLEAAQFDRIWSSGELPGP